METTGHQKKHKSVERAWEIVRIRGRAVLPCLDNAWLLVGQPDCDYRQGHRLCPDSHWVQKATKECSQSEAENVWSYTSTSSYVFMTCWIERKKHFFNYSVYALRSGHHISAAVRLRSGRRKVWLHAAPSESTLGALSSRINRPGCGSDHTHFHLVQRLRLSGAIHLLPIYAFTA